MKKALFVLFLAFAVVFEAKAQEDMIVLRDDLDSCETVRPDVMPKDFHLDYVQLYYYSRLTKALEYPEEAKQNHIRGNVLCTFKVTKDCKLTDYKVFKGLGYGLDELALYYAQLVTNPSEAAEYQGEKVDLLCMLAISFNYEPEWPYTFAKDFSMEKLLDDEAILIGNPQGNSDRRCVNDESEIGYECRVPYVRFKVKNKKGKIAKVELAKSSGFKPLDDEAVMALWNLEYWEGGRKGKDAEYIVPVRFDANLEER